MTHFALLDSKTYAFLLHLKAVNYLWFTVIINSAKKNPKLLKKCMVESKQCLSYTVIDLDDVNVFQICKAANSGLLEDPTFGAHISESPWLLRRELTKDRILSDRNLTIN